MSRWLNDFKGAPVVVFGFGYLAGHFFGLMNPRTTPAPAPWQQPYIDAEQGSGI